MNDLLAIDFGTSHTKVAYFDNLDSKKPQLMEWERSGQSIPSIFYVEADGETIHIGAEALDRIEKPGFQISGFHENLKRLWKKSEPLKAEILEVDLLTELFKEIREHSVGIPVFKQRHPNGVRLTVTDYLGPKERETLTCAAKKAGFTDVDLIEEPEAAALAWHAANGLDENDFIVVDCGGGTLDLAYLHREKENFRVNATVTGLTKEGNPIGGYEVDEALLELVISKLPEKQKQVSKMPLLRQEVRQLKEAYCKNLQLWPLERGIELKQSAGGVKLTDAEIQSTIDNVYITPALEAISPFIKEVEERSRRGVPPILLVGGSSRLKELDQKLRKRFKCEVLSWERAPYAPVLGAALEKKERFVMSGNQADKQVAEDLRTIAGLIGTAGTNIDVNGEQIETPLEMPTAAKQLTAAAERLEEGLLQVAVIGVTCAGKNDLGGRACGRRASANIH